MNGEHDLGPAAATYHQRVVVGRTAATAALSNADISPDGSSPARQGEQISVTGSARSLTYVRSLRLLVLVGGLGHD
ncbi:hypothetical protein SCOCK_140053 [Actinacidiphila cocklensis]|uniref:Uncharacterized protein n=1 Tax=Actinacidiphila cocklensis TaxID=887465 RepID=A0A9W4DKW4_9ACTN|nr:hypothetical protein SCOCK_140053 [Actinacidiphila cocklensis]